jgi:mannose-6-phosphate isomerase-like protein (cupin superfamily)
MIRKPEQMTSDVRQNMRGGTGDITITHYFKKDEFTANTRLCARMTIPPGASVGSHQHLEEDEVYIVLSGKGELDDGTTTSAISAGDAILTGKGGSHAVKNTGDEPLEIVAVIMCYGEKQ